MTRASDRLQVTKLVRGKREQVYQAFADPRLARKWCPDGCRVVSFKADMRVGGSFREAMSCGGGRAYGLRGVQEDHAKPGRRLHAPMEGSAAGRDPGQSRVQGQERGNRDRPHSGGLQGRLRRPGSQEGLVECPQELREAIRRRGQALAPGTKPPLRGLPRRVDTNQVGWWYPGCRPLGRAQRRRPLTETRAGPRRLR